MRARVHSNGKAGGTDLFVMPGCFYCKQRSYFFLSQYRMRDLFLSVCRPILSDCCRRRRTARSGPGSSYRATTPCTRAATPTRICRCGVVWCSSLQGDACGVSLVAYYFLTRRLCLSFLLSLEQTAMEELFHKYQVRFIISCHVIIAC